MTTTRSIRCGFAAVVRHMGSQQILLLALVFGFHAPAQAVTLAVGTTPGTFSVSPFGAATYQIPIELPPGVDGMKPNLALTYNSQAGDGPQGQGWSLSGLSAITRCPQTIAQDNAVHIPDLSANDRFCLDGQRLILTSGTYGMGGSTYHTEIESFQQVTANGSSSAAPTSFTVVDRGGKTRTYSTVVTGGDGSTPLMWLITNITDKYQNYVSFQYSITSGQQPLYGYGVWQSVTQIDYGRSGNAPVGHVVFTYDNNLPGSFRGDGTDRYFAHTYVAANVVAMTGITVESGNGAVLRNYTLGYNFNLSQNPHPNPTRLLSVQECSGADAASGNGTGLCYSPTTFSYGGADTNFNGEGDSLANGASMPSFQVADFDGDGIPDYLYSNNGTLYVLFGKNYGTPVALPSIPLAVGTTPGIGLGGAVVMDINGDGKQELFVLYFPNPGISPDPPTWMMLAQNGNSLALESVPTTDGSHLQGCPSADPGCTGINAIALDPSHAGRMGLLFTDAGKLYYYFNLGGVFAPRAAGTGLTYLGVNGAAPALTPVNFSGSGNSEVYVAGNGVVSWDSSLNSGSGGFKYEATGNFDDANSQVLFLDAYGDGLSGAMMLENGYWFYFPNKGDGTGFLFNSSGQNTYYCAQSPNGTDLTQIQTIDWFHDGRQELMMPVNGVWNLLQATPAGCAFSSTGVSVQSGQTSTRLVDVNGDGQPDLVFVLNNRTEFLYNVSSPYVINEITDGLGRRTDIGYVSTTQGSHGAYVSGDVPAVVNAPRIRPYTGPVYVVKDFAIDSGTFDSQGNAQQIFTYYIYGGAAVDTWGRGFLGFDKVEAINYNIDLYTTNTYRQDFPFTGLVDTSIKQVLNPASAPKSASLGATGTKVTCTHVINSEPDCELISAPPVATTWVTGGQYVSVTANSYLHDLDPYAGVFYPYTSSSQTTVYDLKSGSPYETTGTTSLYKSVATGTPIGADLMPYHVVATTTDANDATDTATVTTDTTYEDDPTAPQVNAACPARPAVVSITNSLGSNTAPAKSETFGYDANCFLTSDVRTIFDPAGLVPTHTLTKSHAPDSFGNPISSAISGDGLTSRATTTFYDYTERFPATIVNPLGQSSTLSHDDWGNVLADTDANGNTVTSVYTALGQKQAQSGPEPNAHVSWSYGSSCSANCAQHVAAVVTQTGSDGSVLVTQSDEVGRVVRTVRTGFSGESILQDTQYDLLGRVADASMPYKAGAASVCWDAKTYDALNRVVTDSQPFKVQNGACLTRMVTTDYSKFTTTNTAADTSGDTTVTQEVTQSVLNVLGKATTMVDAKQNSTLYAYDPWGNPTKVTPPDGASSAVSMTYDSDGNKLAMTDPDMGAWSYTYDAIGELITQTDAKGQTVTDGYDQLGRMTSRIEPEGKTTWKYDIAYGSGIGKLAYALGPNGVWEGYAYDPYGAPTDKITVVNGQEYWVTTTYDDQERVSQIVYPDMTGINVNAAPAVPSGLTMVADPDDNAIFVATWTNVQNGAIYHLFRNPGATSNSSSWAEVYSGPEATMMDDGITANGQYTWSLESCNGANCSAPIAVTLNVTLPPTVPGVPAVPGADTHQNSISLNWTAANLVSTTAGPITYVVKQTNPGGSTTSSTVSTNSMTASLPSDGSYSFIVRSSASGVYSAWSAAGTYQTYMQPSIPQGLSAPATVTPSASPAAYQVTWQAPGFVPTSGVTYTVQENNTLSNGGFTTVQSNGSATYPASQTMDGEYQYQIQACNLAAPTVCSSFVQVGPVAVTLPPTAPGAISFNPPVDYHSGVWGVDWVTSTLNTGSTGTITYYLYEKFGSDGAWSYYGSATSLFINGIVHYINGTYYYALKACTTDPQTNGTACSPLTYSDGYTVVVAPPAPVSLNHGTVNGDGSFDINYGESNPNGIAITYYEAEVGEHDVETDTDSWNDYDCTSSTGTCTVQAGLIAGIYQLRVRACDTSVACSDWYPTVGNTYPKVTINLAPVLSVAPNPSTNGSYTVSWTAPPETVTGYTLYGSVNGGSYSAVVSQAGRSYAATGKAAGSYSYYVIACNGQCSAGSNIVTESVIAAPTGLSTPTADQSPSRNGSFTVSWTAPTGTVTGYNLYESSNGGQTFTLLTSQTGTSYSISGRGTGTYNYYYSACNQTACANSFWLTENVYLPPGTVTGLSLSVNPSNNGSYTLSWNAASGQITDYAVYQSFNGGPYTQVADPSGLGLALSGEANGSFTYYVVARDSGSAAANSATVTESVQQPPPTPQITSMGPNPSLNGSYTLSWPAVSYATIYPVYQSANGGNFTEIGSTGGTSFPITGQGNGSYTYAIAACNSYGCSAPSAHVVENVAPNAPSIDATNYYPKPNQAYTVFWSAPPGPVTGYVLSIDAGYPNQRFVNVSGTSSTFSQSRGDTDWYYQVQACNGSVCGAWSAQIDINVLCGPRGCTAMNIKRDSTQPPAMLAANTPAPANVALASTLPAAAPAASPEIGSLPTPSTASSSLPSVAAVMKPLPVLSQPSLAKLALPPTSVAEAGTPGLSARQAFFLAHAQTHSTVTPVHRRRGPQLAGEWASNLRRAPVIDPRLSMYPPLRKDPRVLAHFEAMGGQLPMTTENAACGVTTTNLSCSAPPATTALMVGYVYNTVGYLAQVQKLDDTTGNPTKVLWQGNDADAMGHMDQEVFDLPCSGQTCSTTGQQFSLVSIFDPVSGVLEDSTGTAVAATVNATYAWDGYNNLLSRNVSESVSTGNPSPALVETFTYDEINRLTGNSATAGSNTVDGGAYNYDSVGDIQAKGGYTAYHYANAAQTLADGTVCTAGHPHAVSDVTVPGVVVRYFCYDANGNLQEETGDVTRTLTWTSFNKPSHIASNGATEDFLYGPGHERLVTKLTKAAGGTVTTVDIDGLFESAYDSTSGYTYRHYVVAGGTRVAVETLQANSSGQQTADTLSFYVHDEVGSVIAAVTENVDSSNQEMSLLSYDAWGKARPTAAGAGAYVTPVAGSSMNPTFAGQKEGFGGHENLDDVGLVEMEGRIYDPEIGRFLSPDPNVQFPDSSQGYNRYTYVNNNPLSLSDPTGYFQVFGGDLGGSGQDAGKIIGDGAPLLSLIPYCEGWCTAAAYAVSGYLESGGSWGAGLRAGAMSIATSEAFSYIGDNSGWFSQNPTGTELFERSVVEGFVGGTASSLSGGGFQDGFVGAFASGMLSGEIGQVGGDRTDISYYTPVHMGERMVLSAIAGGMVSKLTGGDFASAALMAAMQRRFNDDYAFSKMLASMTNTRTPEELKGFIGGETAYHSSPEAMQHLPDPATQCPTEKQCDFLGQMAKGYVKAMATIASGGEAGALFLRAGPLADLFGSIGWGASTVDLTTDPSWDKAADMTSSELVDRAPIPARYKIVLKMANDTADAIGSFFSD